MKYNLIGIHGKPRAGKDALCNHLCSKYKLLRHGPSVHVKDATAAMFNVPRSYFDDDSMKDKVDEFWGISYREMAQKVGKESSRDVFGNDFWMRHVERKIKDVADQKVFVLRHLNPDYSVNKTIPYEGIVLADIRYANEVEWVKAHGGVVIFVERKNRPLAQNEGHPAEHGLDPNLADITVHNDSTIHALELSIDIALADYAAQHLGEVYSDIIDDTNKRYEELLQMVEKPIPSEQVQNILEPTFLTEAQIVQDLLKTLKRDDLAEVQTRSQEELILLHHGPGTYIRNTYKLWDPQNPIVKGKHPDEVSYDILTALWKQLQARK